MSIDSARELLRQALTDNGPEIDGDEVDAALAFADEFERKAASEQRLASDLKHARPSARRTHGERARELAWDSKVLRSCALAIRAAEEASDAG